MTADSDRVSTVHDDPADEEEPAMSRSDPGGLAPSYGPDDTSWERADA